jgi:hypothetical protein
VIGRLGRKQKLMSGASAQTGTVRTLLVSGLSRVSRVFVWIVLALLSLWAMTALYVDIRLSALRMPLMIFYLFVLASILAKYRLRV